MTGSRLTSEYVNVKRAADEIAIKRSPRLKYRPTPREAVAVIPSAIPKTETEKAILHRIDISDDDYMEVSSLRWARRRTQKYNINYHGRKELSRRDGEILPAAALPIKSRRGMRRMARDDLDEMRE